MTLQLKQTSTPCDFGVSGNKIHQLSHQSPSDLWKKKKEKKEITDFSVEQNGFSHRLKTEILKIPTNKQNYSCRLLYTLKLTSR